jgi:HPr kinase/phosphorylase
VSTTPQLKVRDLLGRKGDALQLEVLTGDVGMDREVHSPEASSPGLVLSGYTARFAGSDRLHILGETEITYLASLDAKARAKSIDTFLSYELPCVIVTKGQEVPAELVAKARDKGIPVVRTRLKTAEFYRKLKPFLDDAFAPRSTVHGSLADVFGVGLLFRGRSGIGKSECVLDLVERGHRLVADDVVHITKRGNDVLIGRGHEISRHYMEIRGVGLIDINALFGIRSVRQQKRIEVVVQLEDWDTTRDYERTGLDHQETELLGVALPLVTVPLNPGKNLTVVCEVVAMNHLLRYSGVDSANAFNERLIKRMREKGELQKYLEEDYE